MFLQNWKRNERKVHFKDNILWNKIALIKAAAQLTILHNTGRPLPSWFPWCPSVIGKFRVTCWESWLDSIWEETYNSTNLMISFFWVFRELGSFFLLLIYEQVARDRRKKHSLISSYNLAQWFLIQEVWTESIAKNIFSENFKLFKTNP
jgi:hypothetical protein